MEGDCKAFFTLPASREAVRNHFLSQISYPFLLRENCRAVASSLEYTPCTEVYNAGENRNEQLENESLNHTEQVDDVSLLGPSFNRESTAGSLSEDTNPVVRVLPEVAAFAVQCARCFKWRLVEPKARYEAIRACILECPWVCEDACDWRPNASCEDPADIVPNEEFVWAMDLPNISMPPPGWNRDFVIRSRGASKFGDIYYISPCGKKLRSMVEVDRFLKEHPHYVMEGVSLDRFSYKTPKPLFDGYVGQRRRRPAETDAEEPFRKMRGAIKRNIDIWRPFFPQISKKKRSIRKRAKAVVTNWKL